MTTTLNSSVVQTRKPHRCWGCDHIFPSGSILFHQSSTDDGHMYHSYTCQDCYYETESWNQEDLETADWGTVGYWKDGRWYPASE